MMTKTKTSSFRLVVYLLMVPCTIILMSFVKKQIVVKDVVDHDAKNVATQNIPDIAPVDLTKVTNVVLYGDIMDPRTNQKRNHTGIDFELRKGSDVVATADGVVILQQYGDKRGNFLLIKHDDTYSTRYFHLQSALVKKGDKIRKGQVIGLVGNTGLSAVPHLHYEILKDDSTVDPKDFLPKLPGS